MNVINAFAPVFQLSGRGGRALLTVVGLLHGFSPTLH